MAASEMENGRTQRLDLGLQVLDQQLVDWAGRRSGRVDDIEFEGGPGGEAYVSGLLAGRDALRSRLPQPLRFLARAFGDQPLVRVPWSDVREVSAVIKLKRRAVELGLGRGDDRAHELVGRLPRS